MDRAACPTEHELLARAYGVPVSPELDAHLAECAECRIVLSEIARTSRVDDPGVTGPASSHDPGAPRVQQGELIGGKYRVESVLGTGGMGLVVGAVHGVLGTRVAIKVPSIAARDDEEARAPLT